MTEQEIIECLKGNKTKGVAYLFLPEEVRDWVHDKLFDKILLVLDSMGNFILFEDVEEGLINTDDYDNIVFALPDYYEVKQEPSGEWVECEINKNNDCFFINGHYYRWSEWNTCLIESCNGIQLLSSPRGSHQIIGKSGKMSHD